MLKFLKYRSLYEQEKRNHEYESDRANTWAKRAVEESDKRLKLELQIEELKSEIRKLKPVLHCSFCGKSQHEVRKLIAGPSVFICNECVTLCLDFIGDAK